LLQFKKQWLVPLPITRAGQATGTAAWMIAEKAVQSHHEGW
jgi:hypothetical protein